ncbi:glutamine synthetase family protein [Liquorilactobacillus cacaonum]|uniref:Glutamine synthetase n=1 Tax=Liquorilactobacillus cacaonum DSM 21116 TaxID=1423729 RepID=A0A0R2CNV1_9LACO|nr:glutamine synthetase family protein [Liquorilactobacillus cacaonum]KRM90169.1 glutamine synthetase [Liquorilactobacillus cacaonum DSM 21116]
MSEQNVQDIAKAQAFIAANNIKLIEFVYVDYNGIARGKTITVKKLGNHLTSGIGITRAMFGMNSHDQLQDIMGMTAVGEVRLIPDLSTLTLVPSVKQVATVMCNHYKTSREIYEADPRWLLQNVLKKYENLGLKTIGTYENEFIYFKQNNEKEFEVIDEHPCFAMNATDIFYEMLPDILETLEDSGIDAEQYYPEAGFGQHELSMAPTDLLSAADNEMRFKRVLQTIAKQRDLLVTFAPKPILKTEGNGGHIHLSLWNIKDEKNALYDANDEMKLSQLGKYFVGGLLKHIKAVVALTCPTVNSYQRLQPGEWSSAYATYGQDNREAAVRIPSTYWDNQENSMNIELKASDASANPYLAIAGILIAGLDGIENKIEPGQPVDVDPAALSDKQRENMGIVQLPTTLSEAIEELVNDQYFKKEIPNKLLEAYYKVKKSEVKLYEGFAPAKIAEMHRLIY